MFTLDQLETIRLLALASNNYGLASRCVDLMSNGMNLNTLAHIAKQPMSQARKITAGKLSAPEIDLLARMFADALK